MGWEREIEELHERGALAEAMGGADKVARQHEFGKLTIRERIEAIVDAGSFHEIGKLAGASASTTTTAGSSRSRPRTTSSAPRRSTVAR